MKIDHPAVFLLGAGATRAGLISQATPPPLDLDFFDIASQIKGHGTPVLAKRVLKDVWTLYGRTSGVGLETYYRDIETRDRIGSFARAKHKPKDWRKRKEDLDQLIRRVIIHTTCDASQTNIIPLKSDLHEKLFKLVKRDDTIITFNYDVLIEESFGSEGLWTPKGGYGTHIHGLTLGWSKKWFKHRTISPDKESQILLLKLHGSISWLLYKNKQIRLKPRPYTVRTNNRRPVNEKFSILAPGWNKQIDKNPYKVLWRISRSKLEKCKSLIIIGYSLPETDLLARALISEAVRTRVAQKKWLKQLHIAEPSTDVCDKFVNIFVPTIGHMGSVFKYRDFAEFVKRVIP